MSKRVSLSPIYFSKWGGGQEQLQLRTYKLQQFYSLINEDIPNHEHQYSYSFLIAWVVECLFVELHNDYSFFHFTTDCYAFVVVFVSNFKNLFEVFL